MRKEFTVTGIRHQFGPERGEKEMDARTEAFISTFHEGTTFLLQAEPSNYYDPKAIAVYYDYRRLGYIDRTQVDRLHPLLEANGRCDAVFSRWDGHVTIWVRLKNEEVLDGILAMKRTRQLPPCPLSEEGLLLPFTREESTLELLAPDLLRMEQTAESAQRLLGLAARFVELSQLSICHDDQQWLNDVSQLLHELLSRSDELGYDDASRKRLEALYEALKDALGNCHREPRRWAYDVFERQMERLRKEAVSASGFFFQFDKRFKNGKDSQMLTRLEEWFRQMKPCELRDWHSGEDIAFRLSYLGVTRRELYEVMAAMLLLQRRDAPATEPAPVKQKKELNYFAPTKLLTQLLCGDWFDCFSTNKNKYTCAWREAFVKELMSSPHRDTIASSWPRSHKRIRAHVVGALKRAGVLKDSYEAITRAIKPEGKLRTFSKYMGEDNNREYFDWISEYVKNN